MSFPVLRITVVGHTNTGKTSLIRTLTRDIEFGEVSDRPAVTREVSGITLNVEDQSAIELFDTPGLEDSISLLNSLENLQGDRHTPRVDLIEQFLSQADAENHFPQESKVVRQVLASDVVLYVVDVRERILGKHRDELDILSWCAKPVLPVLNFTAADDAQTASWREQLPRIAMHAIVEFDTVVYAHQDELHLYEKLRTMLDSHRETIDALIKLRSSQRSQLIQASCYEIAELLIDSAALALAVTMNGETNTRQAVNRMHNIVRRREQNCVSNLLQLHRFRDDDYATTELPIEDGRWGLDLFNPQAMKQVGLHAGSAAATGALVGVTLDIMLGGLSLGTGTAAGAAIGALWGLGETHGKRFIDRLRGRRELRCNDATLRLLELRQIMLLKALLHRGHASQQPMKPDNTTDPGSTGFSPILRKARAESQWSRLDEAANQHSMKAINDPARATAVEQLAEEIERKLELSDQS